MSTILGFILFFAILVPLLIFALVAYIVRSVTGNSLTGFIIGFVVWKFFYEKKAAMQPHLWCKKPLCDYTRSAPSRYATAPLGYQNQSVKEGHPSHTPLV